VRRHQQELASLILVRPDRYQKSLSIPSTPGGFLFGYDTSNIGSALGW
jgi:hypothetical protein